MPLLHEKVVVAMRSAHPLVKAAGHLHPVTRIASAIHPVVSLIVDAVAGELTAPPLKSSVGAVFFATTAEATERGRPTEIGVQSLARDILNQLVYIEPAALHQRISDLDAMEEKYKDSGFKPDANYLATKKKLIETSATLDARAASLTPEKVKAEANYSQSFFAFKDQWDVFYGKITSGGINAGAEGELSGNDVFQKIDDFYTQYRQFYQGFIDLGYVPTIKPPAASKAGDTFPDVNIPKITTDLGNFVKPILYTGLAVGAGLLLLSARRPSSEPHESR